MPDIFKFFKKDRENDKATHGHHDDDRNIDHIAQRMGGLTLQQGAAIPIPPGNRRRSTNDFVGGFQGEHGPHGRDSKRDKPLPASPPPFPQPNPQYQPTRYAAPGPLPTPPAIVMPEPSIPGRPPGSLTIQYAQEMWNGNLGYTNLATLGPPTPHLPPRPNSDPSVPTTNSISGRQPRPPVTPKRGSGPPPTQLPATLPKPVKVSGSAFSPAGTPTKPSRKRSASTSALPPTSATSTTPGTYQCSGLTQAGQRCRKIVKANPILTSVLGDDSDDEGTEIQVYCAVHKDKVLDKKEFLSPVTGEYVKFAGELPICKPARRSFMDDVYRLHTLLP